MPRGAALGKTRPEGAQSASKLKNNSLYKPLTEAFRQARARSVVTFSTLVQSTKLTF
jgi:hypothetical protein